MDKKLMANEENNKPVSLEEYLKSIPKERAEFIKFVIDNSTYNTIKKRAEAKQQISKRMPDQLDVSDMRYILRYSEDSDFPKLLTEKYINNKDTALALIKDYIENPGRYQNYPLISKIYRKFLAPSDKEIFRRRDEFYKKYQPIMLKGEPFTITSMSEAMKKAEAFDKQPMLILNHYHYSLFFLKALFTFVDFEQINNLFTKQFIHYDNFGNEIKADLNYSLDNIVDFISSAKFGKDSELSDEASLRYDFNLKTRIPD